MSIDHIDALAKTYADRHQAVADSVRRLHAVIAKAKASRLPIIQTKVAAARAAKAALVAAIEANPESFRSPKTRVLHGVRVGYAKAKGKVVIDDADTVIARIRKHLPKLITKLITVKETPKKTALAELTAAQLKKLGVTVEDAGDKVIVAPTDSEIDKLVDALMSEAANDG